MAVALGARFTSQVTQVPLVQVPAQARPHTPQCEFEVLRLVSQPLLALPSQSPKPALQVKPQLDDAQVVVALARAGHTLPHEPQWLVLFVVFTQEPEHGVCPLGQAATQLPDAQSCVEVHTRPQAPQFARSLDRSRHTPPQLVIPGPQTTTQLDPTHD